MTPEEKMGTDFNDLFEEARRIRERGTGAAATETEADFSDLFEEANQEVGWWEQGRRNMVTSREEFYDSLGLKRGAITASYDMLTDAIFDVLESPAHPIQTSKAIGRGLLSVAEGVSQLASHPIAGGKSLVVEGIYKPFIQYPIALLAGQGTEDERYEMGRSVAANVAGAFVGAVAYRGTKAVMLGQEAILGGRAMRGLEKIARKLDDTELRGVLDGALTDRQLMQLGRSAQTSPFIVNAAAGARSGLEGGFVTGFLEGRTREERWEAATAYSIMALPFGLAMDGAIRMGQKGLRIPDRVTTAQRIAESAGVVAHLRQINSVIDKTPMQFVFELDALAETASIAATLAREAVEYRSIGIDKNGSPKLYGAGASIISQVTDPSIVLEQLGRLADEDRPPVITGIHARGDGLFDVAILPNDTPKKAIDFFEKTGYTEGQLVGWNGSETYYIDGMIGKDNVRIKNAITEAVHEAPLAELSRPAQVTDSFLIKQGKMITADEVYDPSHGLTTEGGNAIQAGTYGSGSLDEAFSQASGYVSGSGVELRRQNGRILARNPSTGVLDPLEPGVHEFLTTTSGGGKAGYIIYVGGKKVMKEVTLPDGTKAKQEVMVGPPDSILGTLAWMDRLDVVDGKRKAGSYSYSIVGEHVEPHRDIVSREMNVARMTETEHRRALSVSYSSLSRGGAASLAANRNRFMRFQIFNQGRVISPQTVARLLWEDFVDYLGITNRRNSEHVQRIAWTDEHPNLFGTTVFRGDVGQTRQSLFEQLDIDYRRHVNEAGEVDELKYVTSEGRVLSQAEAVELMRAQHLAGDVPRMEREHDFRPDRTFSSFDDVFNSYVRDMAIQPSFVPQLRRFIQGELGRELLGMSARRVELDTRTIPLLRERIDELNDEIQVFEDRNLTSAQSLAYLAQIKSERDVFVDRLEMLKKPREVAITEAERNVFTRLREELETSRVEYAKDLVNIAHEHGWFVTRENGVIRLRDKESWQLAPQSFVDEQAAAKWVRDTGHPRGPDLDGGGSNVIPPEGVVGGAMPPSGAWQQVYDFIPDATAAKIGAWIDSTVPWLSPKRAFFTSVDNMFGTTFMRDIYFPLQTARMQLDAKKRPHLLEVQKIEKQLKATKLDRKEWHTISNYREAMSADEIIQGIYRDRPMSAIEVEASRWLTNNKIDTHKVFEYRREAGRFLKDFKEQQRQLAETSDDAAIAALKDEYLSNIEQLQDAFKMDDNHLAAVEIYDKVTSMNPKTARLLGVVRLADALMTNAPTRAEYAAANKMSPQALKIAEQIDKLYSDVAKSLDVDESLNNYLNHYRKFRDYDPEITSLKRDRLDFISDKSEEFASKLMRTGEIDVYERDPIKALINYINAGYNNTGFNDKWKDARNKAVEELRKITTGRDAVKNVLNEYIFGIKGMPAASDELAQVAMDRFLTSIDSKMDVNVRKDLVNTWLAASSGAMLGFRVMQGIRDFTSFSKVYYSRFGRERFNNGLRLAFERDAEGVLPIRKLAEEGKVPGLSVIEFLSEEEILSGLAGKASGRVREAIFKASKAGMEISGQHNAYALAHAIAYLDTHKTAANVLRDLHSGNLDKAQAYKKLFINSYDLPVARAFDELVTEGKFVEAAEFLAQTTGGETAFIFGLSNHPHGWNSNFGRLAGQFGTWSTWVRNYMMRLAGRGTGAERAGAMARYASAEIATWATGRALGFNMTSWFLASGAVFAGGPILQKYEQLSELTGLRGKYRQRMAQQQSSPADWAKTMIPGGLAFADYLKAYQLSQQRYAFPAVIGKGLGFSVDQDQKSWLDELMGNEPQLR